MIARPPSKPLPRDSLKLTNESFTVARLRLGWNAVKSGMNIGAVLRSKADVDAIIADLKKDSKALRQSKSKARKFLQKYGFITKSGKLTKRYRE